MQEVNILVTLKCRIIYIKQMSAYQYMQTVTDSEVIQIAVREYYNDYSMQKYIYNKQLAAKNYMKTVTDSEVIQFSY
mgnify:CR=1 FL=1